MPLAAPPTAARRLRTLAAGLLVLAPGATAALGVVGIEPPARTDAERACYAIAAEIEALSLTRAGTPGFWARTDNRVAGVLTAVSPAAALAYLGYNGYRALEQDARADAAAARIRELRRHSARRSCFVR